MFCPKCGKELPDGRKACGHCGTVFAKMKAPAPEPVQAAPPPQPVQPTTMMEKKPLPKWLIPAVAGGIVVAALLFLLLTGRLSVTVDDVESAPAASSSSGGSSTSSGLDALAGTWEGTAQGDDDSFTIKFSLGSGCQLNVKCGTFFIDDWGIRGDVIFDKIQSDTYYFHTEDVEGEEGDSFEEYLRVVSANELEYYATGSYGTSQGSLYKK